MIRTLLVIALLSTISSPAQAQLSLFLEAQSESAHPLNGLTFDGGATFKLNDVLSLKGFFLIKGKWAEIYFSPAVSGEMGGVKLGGSIGLGGSQSADGFQLRLAGSFGASYSSFSFAGAVEFNHTALDGDDSSLWYDLNLLYHPTKWLAVGLKDRRPAGFGPQVRVKIARMLELWVAWTPLKAEVAEYQPLLIFGAKTFISF